jgi:hypothetical protein
LRFGNNRLPDSYLFRVEKGKLRLRAYADGVPRAAPNCGFPVRVTIEMTFTLR